MYANHSNIYYKNKLSFLNNVSISKVIQLHFMHNKHLWSRRIFVLLIYIYIFN